MPHASPPASNPSLSSSSSVGVVMRDTPIIFAFEIMGDGAGRKIFGEEVSQLLADARLAWAHLDANHAGTATWLASRISDLYDIVIEALLAEETRPRFVPVNDFLQTIFVFLVVLVLIVWAIWHFLAPLFGG